MNIRNSIIDQLEKEADEFEYALSIGLKSGEVVYIDGITKGEKNGYLNFAKHSSDTMILEIDNSLWRIQAQDVESISVKQYKSELDKYLGWFNKLFLSKSYFGKSVFTMWIKWFFVGAVFAVLYSSIKSVLGGDIMTMLMDPALLKTIISDSIKYVDKVFIIVFLIQLALFIIDLVLPSAEPYKKIKPYSDYASETRLNHLIIVVCFFVFYQVFTAILGKIA